MDTHGIMIGKNAYLALKAEQQADESLTDLILRLVDELHRYRQQLSDMDTRD